MTASWKKAATALLALLLTLACLMAAGCSTGGGAPQANTDTEKVAVKADADGADTQADRTGVEAAEALIGQKLTRDEIEAELGEVNKFEMDGAGCERGVYKGLFYYDDYTIYSRTYDQGQTFSVLSVSE